MISLYMHQILWRQWNIGFHRKRVFRSVWIRKWWQFDCCYIRRCHETKYSPYTSCHIRTMCTGGSKRLEKIQLWSITNGIVEVVSFGDIVEVGRMEKIGRGWIDVSDDKLVMHAMVDVIVYYMMYSVYSEMTVTEAMVSQLMDTWSCRSR